MVLDQNYGRMDQNMRVIMKMEKKMVKVSYGFVMGPVMKVNLKIIAFMDRVFIYEVMEKNIKAGGLIIKCRGLEKRNGLMEGNILASILRIKSKDLEHLNEMMEKS